MSKKASIYLRVSMDNQSTESQKAEVERYCQRQEWKIVKTYVDHGISGKKADNRPALNQMLKDVRQGKAGEVVVVYKIDRLARSTADLLKILSELKSAGVDFCSTSQAIDTTTSYGKMVFTFLGAIAEFERETIVERVKSGLNRAEANGVKLGRPKSTIDVKRALELKGQGYSWARIAVDINASVATVRRTISPLLKKPKKTTL